MYHSNSDLMLLVSRLLDVIERIPLSVRISSRAQDKGLDLIIMGTVHPDVEHINKLLEPLRKKFKLDGGNKDQWSSYLREAFDTFKSRIPKLRLSPPLPVSINAIDSRYRRMCSSGLAGMSGRKGPRFFTVRGVDALILPRSPRARNAIVQVASQFNFLESENVYHNDILNYIKDMTQGPRASMGSLSALLLRDAFFRFSDPNAGFFVDTDCYKTGYFMPYQLSYKDQQRILFRLRQNIGDLLILAQWGIPDTGDSEMLQVFTAAPSYQGESGPPSPNSPGHGLCTLLVEAQYRAIAQIAALRSVEIGKNVPLHLTLVGQGAFKNPPGVMRDAFQAVYETVNGFDVTVYFHGFNDSDIKTITDNIPAELGTPPIIETREFFN